MRGARTGARDLVVGVVVLLAAAIFAAGIFSIGSEQRLWARKTSYRLRLPNTNGLQVGAPVRLIGVQVGTVTDIVFSEDPSRNDIDVLLKVDSAVAPRIREDTQAGVKVLSLLGGDKFIELTPGGVDKAPLPPDSYIKVPQEMGFEELQLLGAGIADDLQEITASLKVILTQLQDRNTLIGQALFDPNFGRETLGDLKESVVTTSRILGEIERGQGLAGRLLTDEEFAERTTASLEGSLGRIEAILTRLADENGALMRAADPNGPLTKALGDVESAASALKDTAAGLREGRGVAGRLLTDEAYADRLLGDLASVTHDLKEILGKINTGEGTAGAFVNDPQIHQDIHDLLHGIQESRVMSWLIRRYREKGEKARIKQGEVRKPTGASDGEGP